MNAAVEKDRQNGSAARFGSSLLRPQRHGHQADDEQEADGTEDAAGAAQKIQPHIFQAAVSIAGQEPLQGLIGIGRQQP